MGALGPGSDVPGGVLPHGSDREARAWAVRETAAARDREVLWREAAMAAEGILAAVADGLLAPADPDRKTKAGDETTGERWKRLAEDCRRYVRTARAHEIARPFTRKVHPDDREVA